MREPMGDDHPNKGPHTECLTDHGGRGVPRHCRRGCPWPCQEALDSKAEWDAKRAAMTTPTARQRSSTESPAAEEPT